MSKIIFFFWIIVSVISISCKPRVVRIKSEDMYGIKAEDISFSYEPKNNYVRNDIVVIKYFNKMFNKGFVSVLRVWAIPGDSILIKKGEIYINGEKYKFSETVSIPYTLFFKQDSDTAKIINELNLVKSYIPNSYFLNRSQLEKLLSTKGVDSVERIYFADTVEQTAVIGSRSFGWNMDNLGPVKIRSKNENIPESEKDLYYGIKSTEEKISEDYYFLIGDNFYKSLDSRFIGIIPKSNIEGAVLNRKLH